TLVAVLAELADGFEELLLAFLLRVDKPFHDDLVTAPEDNLERLLIVGARNDVCRYESHGRFLPAQLRSGRVTCAFSRRKSIPREIEAVMTDHLSLRQHAPVPGRGRARP